MMCQEELPKLVSTPLLREFPLGTCIPGNLSEGLGRLKVLMVPRITRNTVIMWAPGLVGPVSSVIKDIVFFSLCFAVISVGMKPTEE